MISIKTKFKYMDGGITMEPLISHGRLMLFSKL